MHRVLYHFVEHDHISFVILDKVWAAVYVAKLHTHTRLGEEREHLVYTVHEHNSSRGHVNERYVLIARSTVHVGSMDVSETYLNRLSKFSG